MRRASSERHSLGSLIESRRDERARREYVPDARPRDRRRKGTRVVAKILKQSGGILLPSHAQSSSRPEIRRSPGRIALRRSFHRQMVPERRPPVTWLRQVGDGRISIGALQCDPSRIHPYPILSPASEHLEHCLLTLGLLQPAMWLRGITFHDGHPKSGAPRAASAARPSSHEQLTIDFCFDQMRIGIAG
jgi:hypothetical protein